MKTNSSVTVCAALLVALGLVACSSEGESQLAADGEPASDEAASALSVGSCDEGAILAQTPQDRLPILQRAFDWVHAGVMYSQSSYYAGYRQDCSGFVSHCWNLGESRTSRTLAPFTSDVSHVIQESELLPGDAFDRAGHVMLFAGWKDDSHDVACVVQENRTGTPANVTAYGRGYFGQFTPIRWNSAGSGAAVVGENGCTQDETKGCGGVGCACADHQCSGGFCAGTGCTAKHTLECAAYGAACVDGQCSGGFGGGQGCTAKEEIDCGKFSCGCADHKCSGGACGGTGCTARETDDCRKFGCGCAKGVCSGGACK